MQAIASNGIDQPMKLALGVALALHVALLLGVSFDAVTDDEHYRPQIDVTLARRPAEQAPDDATHVAQVNQLGSGETSERAEISSQASPTLFNPEPAQQALSPRELREQRNQHERQLATIAEAERRLAEAQAAEEQMDSAMLGISPEVDELTRELANLEATRDKQAANYSNMPRVRRLTSLSTRESIDAAYLHDWRQRVEAVGNQYYPEASIRYGIYGSLRLLVVIDHSGHLEDIRVLSSSGYALLDEAAIKIVRMASPYAPFPPELRATTDKLEIIRTWQFQENRLSSG
ncbi:energy transducer TonB [Parahaliea maris]|uniref:Energy transducer TonB n=1 Tax=Parahaliea maris TaxID=2716870 RepID=A0A5C8ZTS7_9GAMM|nr:energy transducer TonB [Parahaliea maris]TXS90671.1 energy transducer TonB [Parahaliea maris]